MGLSAFTDGLSSGMQTVSNVKNAKRYADIYKQYADNNAEGLRMKREEMDRAPQFGDILSMFSDVAFGDQSLMPRSRQAQDPVMLKPLTERPTYGMGAIKGYAQGGLVSLNDGVFSGGVPPSSSGLTALAAPPAPPPQQAQPQQQAQEEQLTPQQRFTKALMTTDVLSNPDKLSKIQAIAEMNGMGKALTPWLERAYAAKKTGMIDGAMQLMQGRVDDAIDSLRRGGVKLADRPEPADPNNPRLWKINIEGTGERTVDIGDLLQTTLDPEKFLKMDLEKSESQGKRNVSDSQVRENDARVRVSNAQVGKLGEETKSIKAERSAAGLAGGPALAKLPAPVATAEWLVQKGVYPDHKSAFAAVKTLNDKSPEAQRQELIKARMRGGLTSLSDAAKEVDEFMTQEGSKEPGQGTPPPAKKVLIFGKDFK